MKKAVTLLLTLAVIFTSCVTFADEQAYTIATDRASNQLALADVYYTSTKDNVTAVATKVEKGSTMTLYSDIINTYSLEYMTSKGKVRYNQQVNSLAVGETTELSSGKMQYGSYVEDASFRTLMCVYDGNRLLSCSISTLALPAAPGWGINYRQGDVEVGSVTVPADAENPVLKTFIWRKTTNEYSHGADNDTSTYDTTTKKAAEYIKGDFEPEFEELVLTSESNDNEIKSIELNGYYGYVNHDRNTIRFILSDTYNGTGTPNVTLADDAELTSEGTLAEGTLKYTVTAENGDKKTYSVTFEDGFSKIFEENFNSCTTGAVTEATTGDTAIGGMKATSALANASTFEIKARTDGDYALWTNKSASGGGACSLQTTYTNPSGYLTKTLFKFDCNIASAAPAVQCFMGQSYQHAGTFFPNMKADGTTVEGKFALGTMISTAAYGKTGNSVYTGSMNNWETFAFLGSMHTQKYGTVTFGGKQYTEVYNFVDGKPNYLGEYFVFDYNTEKTSLACDEFAVPDATSYTRNSSNWGFGVPLGSSTANFGVDNILFLGKTQSSLN